MKPATVEYGSLHSEGKVT